MFTRLDQWLEPRLTGMANPTNENATIRQRQLAARLRELRDRRTSAEVQAGTGITPSKLSRIESCHVRARPGDVEKLATFYGAPSDQVELLVSAAEEAWSSTVMRDYIGSEWAAALRSHLELEADAQRIESYTIDLVPGLLQTREYTRALIESRPDVDKTTVDSRLDFRDQRQRRVKSGELELWAVVGETVLHQMIGGPVVLADQLDYLRNPPASVTTQVLPFEAGPHAALGSSFHIFTFPEFASVVYQDTIKKGLYQDDHETVDVHRKIMEQVRATALSPNKTVELLDQRIRQLREGK